MQADYIIIGSGSAGSALAYRLSEDGRNRVLVLEYGGSDRGPFIQMPAALAWPMSMKMYNWGYLSEPEPNLNNRRITAPRGKVIGGSSSINGLLYIRGQHADYDGWRQLGCEGWGWDDVAPYFRRAEHQERGDCEWHATGGPLNVSDVTEKNPISNAVIEACEQAGIPRNDDVNGGDQEGATYYQLTVKNGQRCSAAVAYLHPAMKRPNLQVETNALAGKVLFEGKRAVGVEFTQNGVRRVARARAEVILAGGAVNSPQLLQLSGVGPAELLIRNGIKVVADLPGVGENLQDHYVMSVRYRLKAGVVSVNEQSKGGRLAGEALRYLFQRKGLLTLSAAHIAAFCKSRPDLAGPDIQFHILPATMDLDKLVNEQKMELENAPGLTIAPASCAPRAVATCGSGRPIRPSIRPSSPTTWPIRWTRRSPSRG